MAKSIMSPIEWQNKIFLDCADARLRYAGEPYTPESVCAEAKRMSAMHDQVYKYLPKKARTGIIYKKAFQGYNMDFDIASVIRLSFVSLSVGDIDDLAVNHFSHLSSITAENIIKAAYKNNQLNELLDAIDECRSLYPALLNRRKWSDREMSQSTASLFCKYCDLGTRADIGDLTLFLVICYPETDFLPMEFITNLYIPALEVDRVQYVRAHREEYKAILNPFITTQQKKSAIKAYTKAMAALYFNFINYYIQNGAASKQPEQSLLSPFSLRQAPLMGKPQVASKQPIPVLQTARKYFADFEKELAKPNKDVISRYFNNETFNYGLALSGAFFLGCENPAWLDAMISHNAQLGMLAMSNSRHCLKLLIRRTEEQKESACKQIGNRLQPAIDFFYDRDAILQAEETAPIAYTNQQAYSACGLSALYPEGTFPEASMLKDEVIKTLSEIQPKSDVVLGAAFAVALMSSMGLEHTTLAEHLRRNSEEQAKEIVMLKNELVSLNTQIQNNLAIITDRDAALNSANAKVVELEARVQTRDKELDDIKAEKKAMQEQIDALLLAMQSMSEETTIEDNEASTQFPASLDGVNAVLYGGFPKFLLAIQNLLPELRTFQPDRRVDANVAQNADIVFLQVNCMGHPMYYTITNICRQNNIPYVILNSSSASNAASQILDAVAATKQKTGA